jgi:putative flippase GtrA
MGGSPCWGHVTDLPGPSMNASQIIDGVVRPGMNGGWEPTGVWSEIFRYILVGSFAFVCDTFTLFSLTHFLKVNYLVSAPIGFLLGTAVTYVLSRTWVFQRRTLKNTSAELTIFALIGVVGLGLNELILWFFQSKLGIYYLFAKGVSGITVFVWNFGARKLTLFR